MTPATGRLSLLLLFSLSGLFLLLSLQIDQTAHSTQPTDGLFIAITACSRPLRPRPPRFRHL
jgi:hypothetical protein